VHNRTKLALDTQQAITAYKHPRLPISHLTTWRMRIT